VPPAVHAAFWRHAPLSAVLMLPACARPIGGDPSAIPRESAAPADVSPAPAQATAPRYDDPPSEIVLAYLASCDHQVQVEDEYGEGGPMDECNYREFDQNCAPDPSGCWEAEQACISACDAPCTDCQTECGSTCGSCKATCSLGDDNCVRHCAEQRATCRDTCMATRDQCQGAPCRERASACDTAFEDAKATTCPQCDEISQCFVEAWERDDTDTFCRDAFPKADDRCFEWCHDMY
jgi:hypothetical protein